jgi:hypothetical protein
MSQQQQQKPLESSGTNVPGDAPGAGANDAPDVSRQIAALTEAVNQLVRAQQPRQGAPDAPAAPADAAASAARERYVREHLGDLPEAYRRQMPQSADARQLADAEASIRRQFREDLRTTFAGASSPQDVGGDIAPAGGHPVVGSVDAARLSPVQQIALGLRGVTPVGPGRPDVIRARGGGTPPGDVDAVEHATVPAGAD